MLLWFAGPSGAVFVSDGPRGPRGYHRKLVAFLKEGILNNNLPASPKNTDKRRWGGFCFHFVRAHLHALSSLFWQRNWMYAGCIPYIYTHFDTHTHTLVIKLVLQRGFCVQYVFISCLVLHLITGKSHGCTEYSNLSFGSAEENPTPLLFPAFKIFLCNWINDEHKKKKNYTQTQKYTYEVK